MLSTTPQFRAETEAPDCADSPDDFPRSELRRVAVYALGCKANQEEMETLVSRLVDAGFEVVPFGATAEWTIVNTCTVTQQADSDSRQLVRKAIRANPEGRVVATGCLAQRVPDELASMPGVHWVVGNGEKALLDRWIVNGPPEHSRGLPARLAAGANEPLTRGRAFVTADPTADTFLHPGTTRVGRRTRASLKIQDGCDEHCTFCIIPEVRGSSRSRPLADIDSAARQLANAGFRELALTGINTALWGRDLDPPRDLLELLSLLERVPDLERVRLNSLEPQYVTREWLAGFARLSRLCRHLHLPLQSGDAAILKRMNRRYDLERYADVVHETLRHWPGAAVGADVLVGFPGESKREFDNTYAFLEALPLAYLHVFRYSARPGTPAPRFGASVSVDDLKQRSGRLRALGMEKRLDFVRSRLGTEETVIPEGPDGPGFWQGLTGNYIRVRFAWSSREAPTGRGWRVHLSAEDGVGGATGSLLDVSRSAEGVDE